MYNELYHYGIPGMKWGVRRYQNFDGSYTKAGLKRLQNSQDILNEREQTYKNIRRDKSKSKYEKQYAKAKVKEAKRQVKKDYKHLALDKKADEGKLLYAQGKRIRSNYQATQALAKAAAIITIGSQYAAQYGYIDSKTATYASSAAIGLTVVSGMKSLIDEIPNNKLRAYYGHTSNY